MKTLTLELKKKILIREYKDIDECRMIKSLRALMPSNGQKLLCKGSELTEEIAKVFVKNEISDYLVEWAYDYKNDEPLNLDTFSCKESFISAIEANGYYWGENPKSHPAEIQPTSRNHYDKLEAEWREAESKTFNPEKSLIFEIL